MQKLIMLAVTAGLLMATPVTRASRYCSQASPERTNNWVKSKTGAWAGQKGGKSHWYKLDKNARLWWSPNGHDWTEVTDGIWNDKQDRWMKIGEGKLWWTADEGKNFEEVPEWKWQGPRGEWYKFDAKWTLWVTR